MRPCKRQTKDTILDTLFHNHVVEIRPDGEGFRITEQCDEWYHVYLSRDELRELASELFALADTPVRPIK
jgi:DNA-binding IclR family transcriptional regulator